MGSPRFLRLIVIERLLMLVSLRRKRLYRYLQNYQHIYLLQIQRILYLKRVLKSTPRRDCSTETTTVIDNKSYKQLRLLPLSGHHGPTDGVFRDTSWQAVVKRLPGLCRWLTNTFLMHFTFIALRSFGFIYSHYYNLNVITVLVDDILNSTQKWPNDPATGDAHNLTCWDKSVGRIKNGVFHNVFSFYICHCLNLDVDKRINWRKPFAKQESVEKTTCFF